MAAVITRADEPGAVPRTVFFGLLNDVASDPQVTDLAVTCDGRVWADRGNGMRETVLHVPFRSPQVVREYAVQLCAQLGRRLDDACPIADAASQMGVLKGFLGTVVTNYPWAYALVLFFTSKLVNSQGAAVAIVMPMALKLGMDPVMVLSFIPACYGYFFLPTYPSDLACIGFDRSGTTRIGKFVLNHSFMLPGLTGVFTACVAGFVIAHILY